jgi:hypothetical protein
MPATGAAEWARCPRAQAVGVVLLLGFFVVKALVAAAARSHRMRRLAPMGGR